MQDGPAGKLWTLCGNGEALSDSQTHPGVHHRATRGQGWHKEILLNPKTIHHVSPLQWITCSLYVTCICNTDARASDINRKIYSVPAFLRGWYKSHFTCIINHDNKKKLHACLCLFRCVLAEVPVSAAGPPPLLHPPCVRSFAAAWSRAQLPGATSGKHHRPAQPLNANPEPLFVDWKKKKKK